MIHIARKLFVLLLIAAVTAGFAQPLVWCVSGSDHSRIEFKIGGNGHAAALPEKAHERLASCVSPEWKLVDGDCVDSEFFPQAVENATPDLPATAAPAPHSLKWGLLPPVRAPSPSATAGFSPAPPSLRAATSQLDHIRTVVLLT